MPEPGNPQALNRYSYTLDNPLIYRDPTGHGPECMQFAALGPLGGVAVLGCQVVQAAITYGPQLVQLATNLSEFASSPLAQLALQQAQITDAAAQQAASQAGNTSDPGQFDPNKWDPNRFGFKSGGSLRSHFEKHVLNSADEAWHELFGLSREELAARVADPSQLARLQNTYVQLGQKASNASNYIGVQAKGQQVFVDTSTKITAILQGDKFVTVFRITTWEQFVRSMEAQGLRLAPGVNLDALKAALGY